MDNKNIKFSIKERQRHAFDAAVENTKQANAAVKSAQNWVNVFALAQLAFLSSLSTQGEYLSFGEQIFIKIFISLLILSIILFLYGAILQYRHLLDIARKFFTISSVANNDYLKKGIYEVLLMPNELEFPDYTQLKSSNLVNRLFVGSFIVVCVVSVGIVILIFLI